MKTNYFLVIIFALITVSVPAFGFEYIVDSSGGGDAITIQGGLDLASSGDQVTVLPGTYFENLTMVSGVFLVSAAGPDATVIDGNDYICINCEQCGSGTRISGFTLTKGGGYTGGGIRLFDYCDVEIDNNYFIENQTTFEGAGITVQQDTNANIHHNRFIGNISYKTSAITVIVGSHATIRDNFFKQNISTIYAGVIGVNSSSVVVERNLIVENRSGTYAGGIDFSGASGEIRNNSFIRNLSAGGGSCIRGAGGDVTVENNLFAHNGGPAVQFYSCQNVSCNIFWDNEIGNSGACDPVGENNNEHINPLVCNPHTDNCQVSEYSPCLSGPCGLIGAQATPGCTYDIVATDLKNWGTLKSMYR